MCCLNDGIFLESVENIVGLHVSIFSILYVFLVGGIIYGKDFVGGDPTFHLLTKFQTDPNQNGK